MSFVWVTNHMIQAKTGAASRKDEDSRTNFFFQVTVMRNLDQEKILRF